jgi:hypothetical protein
MLQQMIAAGRYHRGELFADGLELRDEFAQVRDPCAHDVFDDRRIGQVQKQERAIQRLRHRPFFRELFVQERAEFGAALWRDRVNRAHAAARHALLRAR